MEPVENCPIFFGIALKGFGDCYLQCGTQRGIEASVENPVCWATRTKVMWTIVDELEKGGKGQ